MKTLPAVAGSLVGLLAVLSLPGPEPPVAPAPARGHGFAWNQDAFWHSLEKTYGDARAVGCRAADPVVVRELSALGSTADRLLGTPLDPGAAVLDSVERRFFTLAPLFAACPRHLGDYVRLSGRLREAIKWQSRRWDVAGDAARARLYRSLYGLRGAVEEVMLHHPDSVAPLLAGRQEPSATPATTVQGVEIHSGDILVSRGGYPTSALIARGNDYPGNFSHIALVHVDSVSHVASAIEAHIERGVAVSTADEYLGDKKLRIMVLRLRADLPQLARDPQLPHRAGALALERARSGRIGYAVIDAMLEGAEAGDVLSYAWCRWPVARLAKAYSWIVGRFGAQGPVPEGMSARAALRNGAFSDRQRQIAARVTEAAARLTKELGYPPPYWVLLDLARREKAASDRG